MEATLGERLSGERNILRGLRDVLGMGAQNALVTHGGKPAYLMTPKRAWRFSPPALERRVNPIGSGDCTTGGLAHALLRGRSMKDAVAFGLACGSANVETLTPADIDPVRVRVLRRAVQIEPM